MNLAGLNWYAIHFAERFHWEVWTIRPEVVTSYGAIMPGFARTRAVAVRNG